MSTNPSRETTPAPQIPAEASPSAAAATANAKRPASPAHQDQHTDSKRVKTDEGTERSRETRENGKMSDVDMESTQPTSESSLPAPSSSSKADPGPQQISMRSLIVTQDASIIIGRGGAHVNEIRDKSSARVTVSESIPGNPERILNVSGPLDAVAKAFGLIVRRINDEPFDVPSVPGSRAVTIKFIIPNSRMGSVIGKGGSKIKEIQEASGARLNASEAMLPGSTERVLSVSGVADAVHIAVYYIGTILLEYQEKFPAQGGGSYRQSSGGERERRGPPPAFSPSAPPPPGMQQQQIFIPNAFVGAIIGRAGAKINEIRTQSACQIRVTDPGSTLPDGPPANPEERLVVITGYPENIQSAITLLYSRVEAEREKLASEGM